MKIFEFIAEVDQQSYLQIALPPSVRPGRVRVLVLVPEKEDEVGAWMRGVARE